MDGRRRLWVLLATLAIAVLGIKGVILLFAFVVALGRK